MLFALARELTIAEVVWAVTVHLAPPMNLVVALFLTLRGRFRARHILITLLIGGVAGQMAVFIFFWPPIWDWPIGSLLWCYLDGGYAVSAFAVCAGMGASCMSLEFLGPRFVRRDKPSIDANISGGDRAGSVVDRERKE